MEQEDEIYYITRILDGETEYFSVLLDRYSRPLYSLIVQIVGCPEDAEELLQDVFLKAFRNLSGYKQECRFSTWLYRIAYNTSISATRKRKQEFLYIEESAINNVPDEKIDEMIALGGDEEQIECLRKAIDQLEGEEKALITLFYYEEECEANPSTDREKIIVLGGGPNRIGQGIEFDYCCVHASLALREDGYETIMVNCNPETVSTDYDTSDRLYFEPVTLEDVLEIVRIEKPKGVIVQYGGQTPLKLARALEAAGVPVIGTSPDAIDRAEDRERFQHAVERLKLKQPANATVTTIEMAVEKAKEIGYPLVVRPSYVLGGRAMEIVYDEADLRRYFQTAVSVSNDAPVLLDHFLDDAVEVDHEMVKAICEAVDIPVIAIGGITKDNVQELSGCGLCGIAVISAIFAKPDIKKATEELKAATEKMVKAC